MTPWARDDVRVGPQTGPSNKGSVQDGRFCILTRCPCTRRNESSYSPQLLARSPSIADSTHARWSSAILAALESWRRRSSRARLRLRQQALREKPRRPACERPPAPLAEPAALDVARQPRHHLPPIGLAAPFEPLSAKCGERDGSLGHTSRGGIADVRGTVAQTKFPCARVLAVQATVHVPWRAHPGKRSLQHARASTLPPHYPRPTTSRRNSRCVPDPARLHSSTRSERH